MGSAMLKDPMSPMAGLPRLPGVRKLQQVHQCAHGCNDNGAPVKKATAMVANVKMNRTAKRCNGHHGVQHAVLQGSVGGINRTAMAAVYPMRMCRAIVEDVWKFTQREKQNFKKWPNELLLMVTHGYECERCTMGRAALPWMEHTFIPGQCRYGRHPAGEGPRARQQVEDPLAAFKRRARQKPMTEVKLETSPTISLNVDQSFYLKYTLMVMVQDCLTLFTEAVETGADYRHWVVDPVHKAMITQIFQKDMIVKGIVYALNPWHCMVPEPQLSSRAAPLRLQISGNVKDWNIHDLEDLRELSHSQQRQKIDEIGWLITIFGSDKVGAVPAVPDPPPGDEPAIPATPTKHGHRKPEADTSKLPPPASKDKIADDEDVNLDGEGDPVETFDAAPIENLKPLHNFRKVFQRLLKIADTDQTTAKRLILGLHERFYHAPLGDLRNMLARCGCLHQTSTWYVPSVGSTSDFPTDRKSRSPTPTSSTIASRWTFSSSTASGSRSSFVRRRDTRSLRELLIAVGRN